MEHEIYELIGGTTITDAPGAAQTSQQQEIARAALLSAERERKKRPGSAREGQSEEKFSALARANILLPNLPPARAGHSTVAVKWGQNQEFALVVFGGYDGAEVRNDLHVFTNGRWVARGMLGNVPPPRAMHAACMLGDHMIVFGGWGGHQTLRSDTCMLNVPALCWLSPPPLALVRGPSDRQGHSLVAAGDEVRAPASSQLLLFGGETFTIPSNELWAFKNLARGPAREDDRLHWMQLKPSGTWPKARSGHSACMLSPNEMVVFGGRGAGKDCLNDLHVLSVSSLRWSTPRLHGDVPRPRWAAACCLLPSRLPSSAGWTLRWLLDGGRDFDGWVDEQVVANVAISAAGEVTLNCHALGPSLGHPSLELAGDAVRDTVVSGHTLTALPQASGGGALLVGGSLATGELPALARHWQPSLVRWIRAEVAPQPESGGPPPKPRLPGQPVNLPPQLTGPPLLASSFTATRCGQYVYVLGGHRPMRGQLGLNGGGLCLAILHLPSLSWCPSSERIDALAPKLKTGHSAALLPSAGGICIFGGERSSVLPGVRGCRASLSDECWVLQLRIQPGEYAPRAPGAASKFGAPGGAAAAARAPVTPVAAVVPRTPDLIWADTMTVASALLPSAPRPPRPPEPMAPPFAPPRRPVPEKKEWDGQPVAWAKEGGPYHAAQPGWPVARAGHTATVLPSPYAWGEGPLAQQEAMLVIGGFAVDSYAPEQLEGLLTASTFLMRPHDARWLELLPAGTPPTARALHSAVLLADVTGGAAADAASSPNMRVAIFGGFGLEGEGRGEQVAPWRQLRSAKYLDDLHVLTLSPSPDGRLCHWVALKPPGPRPMSRAGSTLLASRDGGVLLFGGHTANGCVSEPYLDVIGLSGCGLRAAEAAAKQEARPVADPHSRVPSIGPINGKVESRTWTPRAPPSSPTFDAPMATVVSTVVHKGGPWSRRNAAAAGAPILSAVGRPEVSAVLGVGSLSEEEETSVRKGAPSAEVTSSARFLEEEDPRLRTVAGSVEGDVTAWTTDLMSRSCHAFSEDSRGSGVTIVPKESLEWRRPDAAGYKPAATARMAAVAMDDHVLLFLPPPAADKPGKADLGPEDEPGTALFICMGDGVIPDEVQSRFCRNAKRGKFVPPGTGAVLPLPQPANSKKVAAPSKSPPSARPPSARGGREDGGGLGGGGEGGGRGGGGEGGGGAGGAGEGAKGIDRAAHPPSAPPSSAGVSAFHHQLALDDHPNADGRFHCSSSTAPAAFRDGQPHNYLLSAHHLKYKRRAAPPTKVLRMRVVRRLAEHLRKLAVDKYAAFEVPRPSFGTSSSTVRTPFLEGGARVGAAMSTSANHILTLGSFDHLISASQTLSGPFPPPAQSMVFVSRSSRMLPPPDNHDFPSPLDYAPKVDLSKLKSTSPKHTRTSSLGAGNLGAGSSPAYPLSGDAHADLDADSHAAMMMHPSKPRPASVEPPPSNSKPRPASVAPPTYRGCSDSFAPWVGTEVEESGAATARGSGAIAAGTLAARSTTPARSSARPGTGPAPRPAQPASMADVQVTPRPEDEPPPRQEGRPRPFFWPLDPVSPGPVYLPRITRTGNEFVVPAGRSSTLARSSQLPHASFSSGTPRTQPIQGCAATGGEVDALPRLKRRSRRSRQSRSSAERLERSADAISSAQETDTDDDGTVPDTTATDDAAALDATEPEPITQEPTKQEATALERRAGLPRPPSSSPPRAASRPSLGRLLKLSQQKDIAARPTNLVQQRLFGPAGVNAEHIGFDMQIQNRRVSRHGGMTARRAPEPRRVKTPPRLTVAQEIEKQLAEELAAQEMEKQLVEARQQAILDARMAKRSDVIARGGLEQAADGHARPKFGKFIHVPSQMEKRAEKRGVRDADADDEESARDGAARRHQSTAAAREAAPEWTAGGGREPRFKDKPPPALTEGAPLAGSELSSADEAAFARARSLALALALRSPRGGTLPKAVLRDLRRAASAITRNQSSSYAEAASMA